MSFIFEWIYNGFSSVLQFLGNAAGGRERPRGPPRSPGPAPLPRGGLKAGGPRGGESAGRRESCESLTGGCGVWVFSFLFTAGGTFGE